MTVAFTPPQQDLEQLKALAERLSQADGPLELVLGQGDHAQRITLSPLVAQLLQASVHALGDGHTVALVATDQELTPAAAARMLGISRPHLVNALLHTGQLPYRMEGTHHRIALSDVLAYRDERDRRHAAADALTQLTEAHQLYGQSAGYPQ